MTTLHRTSVPCVVVGLGFVNNIVFFITIIIVWNLPVPAHGRQLDASGLTQKGEGGRGVKGMLRLGIYWRLRK